MIEELVFNASQSTFAPISPILQSIGVFHVTSVCLLLTIYANTIQILHWVKCWPSAFQTTELNKRRKDYPLSKRVHVCQCFSFASQIINILTTNRDWSQRGICLQWFSEWCYPCVHDYVFCCFDMFVLEKSAIPFLVSRLFTVQIEFCECCVWLQCFTQRCCSQVSENVVCNVMIMKRVICWWMSFVCSFFCPHNSDWVRWVLCLISTLHSSYMLHSHQCHYLSFCAIEKHGSIQAFVVCISFLCPLPRLRLVSVVLVVNASLNSLAPIESMWLPVDRNRDLLMNAICCFFWCSPLRLSVLRDVFFSMSLFKSAGSQ